MRREILAGLSTFFTVAYYFLLFPKILSEGGFDFGAALSATILSLVIPTLFLAFYGRFPALVAPAISIGAYLVYSVIIPGKANWETSLGVVFWAGLVMFLLTLFKVRQKIFMHLPHSIISSAIAGIGLFLICVGLRDLSILKPDPQSFLSLGPLITAPNGIALFGLVLFAVLYRFRITSAFLLSILACWAIALCFGLTHWQGIASLPPSPLPSFLKLDLGAALHPDMWRVFVSVMLIALFDSTAALTALARMAHAIDHKGQIKKIDRILIADSGGSVLSSLLGSTTLSFLLESSSGIKSGGRGGITALTAALCSLACLFLYPLISSIPVYASTPALIAIGCFMTSEAKGVLWRDWTEALPAILILLTIPLTFSIYTGFAYGVISYVLLKGVTGQWKKLHPVSWGLSLIFAIDLVWSV